jgi:dTDP-4-amino-4,6-dideoxygalactose transaminase
MNLNIQMVDTKSQFLKIKEEIYKGFEEVFESSQFINGKQVKEFTEALKSFTRAKYIIPCANGTDAIQVALMALGLEPGDEVIVPTWTYVATAEVIALLKLKPIFIDADYNTFNIDVNKIEEKITSKTKAIVPVHLYGQTCEMEKIMELAKKYNLIDFELGVKISGAGFPVYRGKGAKLQRN